ncbi:hypothetical protein F2Q68_00040780 [Brassica cretica]|uniref:RRM domain-containing protein n=1 Tax=Brassica cretica TaxID=69181 RepID=A0A8S9MDZ2_BRACR|nr:hypothetical protein F2Q68_00040780 [Brassica cretica]
MDHQNGFGVEVTGLSPAVTEKDLIDFFSFSGAIQHIDIVRSGEQACTAYVMFKDSYSQETAVLLSGATILEQRVCITRWGQHHEEFDFWNATQRASSSTRRVHRRRSSDKSSRSGFTKLRQEKRVVPDGVNAKFFSCHGPLANRQPGTAFLPATY